MKRVRFAAVLAVVVFLCAVHRGAAQVQSPDEIGFRDSLVYVPVPSCDTTLSGKDIFGPVLNGVEISQDTSIRRVMYEKLEKINPEKTVKGYRIRIYFDNSRNSRSDSETAMRKFRQLFPEIPAYRTFGNPYFKVTVGDYRTKSEAMSVLPSVKAAFPTAFIVRESFRFPALEGDIMFEVDTVKVPVRGQL